MSMIQEFREFALKGNAFDLAIGVVIGAAFGKIVDSLVADIIMPLIGLILPGDAIKNLSDVAWNGIKYGNFIGIIINFLIVGFALFMVVKVMNKLRNESAPAAK
jgi:large conductance mechanosensitive channel